MDVVNTSGLVAAWTMFMTWIPRVIACFAILLIGWLIAGAVRKLVDKLLGKVHFDRLVERGELKAHIDRAGFSAGAVISSLIYYSLWLVTLTLAFNVFGPNPVSDLLTRMIAYLPNVFVALVIIMVAAAISSAVRGIIAGALGGLSYGKALATAASAAILMVGIFAALDQLQIAPMIVNGLFYSILAIVVGSSIIAIGGGGIQPMRQVWDSALTRVQQETPRIQQEAKNAKLRVEQGGQASAPSQTQAAPLGSSFAGSTSEQTHDSSEAIRRPASQPLPQPSQSDFRPI